MAAEENVSMSRFELLNLATNIMAQHEHPPTFNSVFDLLQSNYTLDDQERAFLRAELPPYFGTAITMRVIFDETSERLTGEEFPLDVTNLILKFRGQDDLHIKFGKYRSQGAALKKAFACSDMNLVMEKRIAPRHFTGDANLAAAINEYLEFAIFLNGSLVYGLPKNNITPDVLQIWRAICKFETSQEQWDNLRVWKEFVPTLAMDTWTIPVSFQVSIAESDERAPPIFEKIFGDENIQIDNIILNSSRQMIVDVNGRFSRALVNKSKRKGRGYTDKVEVMLGAAGEYMVETWDAFPDALKFKRTWNTSGSVKDLTTLIQSICSDIKGRWAETIFKQMPPEASFERFATDLEAEELARMPSL